MRTGILLALIGAWIFARTIFADDNHQTLVGRLVDGSNTPPTPPSSPASANKAGALSSSLNTVAGAANQLAAAAAATSPHTQLSATPPKLARRPSSRSR